MKRKISLLLILVLAISAFGILSSCSKNDNTPQTDSVPVINGVSIKDFTIVYDQEGLDYNQRAAEYIQNQLIEKFGLELPIIDDGDEKQSHEIVVGETSRSISSSLNEDTVGFEFAILAQDGSVALEGDYFVIAAAAYFFVENYASAMNQSSSISEAASIHQPIVKDPKNFIMLIGDGMGLYQTRMFDYFENTSEISDGEDIFYGYMFPYMGYSRTESLSGITDSAAGGTALSCGIKTINGHIGIDENLNDVQSLTELAYSLGMSAAVMSTEIENGATPASFFAHADSRNDQGNILRDAISAYQNYGTVIDCGYDYYKINYMRTIEGHIEETLEKISANENGFFIMYEEAYIDKHCHNNAMEKTFITLTRFNQAIARFMEFAFYNPETFVLITADHETGLLMPDESGKLAYNSVDHSAADVPIFAYGCGAELFNNANVENIQIAHTFAALMGEENFGDQSVYQSLTKGNK